MFEVWCTILYIYVNILLFWCRSVPNYFVLIRLNITAYFQAEGKNLVNVGTLCKSFIFHSAFTFSYLPTKTKLKISIQYVMGRGTTCYVHCVYGCCNLTKRPLSSYLGHTLHT